jgi:outer membrane usher protein
LASNHYGRPLAVGSLRRGLTDQFTAEVRGEVLEDQQTVGFGGVLIWPAAGVFSASVAGSRSKPVAGAAAAGVMTSTAGGSGGLLGLGFQGQRYRFGYGASVQLASENFTQIGLESGRPAPRRSSQAYINFSTSRAGSFGLSYTHQDRRDAERVELLNASYNLTLGKFGFLGLSLLRILGEEAASGRPARRRSALAQREPFARLPG